MAPDPSRSGVTVVIPVLRQRVAWLEQAVRSAVAQTVACEVIVVTSSLTPAANHEALRSLADGSGGRLAIVEQARRGFPGAVNTGFERAAGARVGLLFSDDWLAPTAVEACAPIPADIVSTGHRGFAADGVTALEHLNRTPRRAVYDTLATLEEKAVHLTHFLLFDRASVLAAGGLDESLGDAPGIDDYDLVWTLLERGASVGLTERPLYNYRVHDEERLTLRSRPEQLRVLENILDKHRVTGEERARLIERHVRWFGRPEDIVQPWPAAAEGTGPT